ncbi:hypothetical protein JKP88DRAFT_267256 [Tribonema minus]|uniref:Uncharacterized protein n=1 Tax=Tribonema minus TaxID=303371 RepID=A0A835ZDR6_9STRA|nr:hypothetical protein JKP88DRAFT_267256 [Tribonema minus]
MAALSAITPLRFGIMYKPPTLALEYEKPLLRLVGMLQKQEPIAGARSDSVGAGTVAPTAAASLLASEDSFPPLRERRLSGGSASATTTAAMATTITAVSTRLTDATGLPPLRRGSFNELPPLRRAASSGSMGSGGLADQGIVPPLGYTPEKPTELGLSRAGSFRRTSMDGGLSSGIGASMHSQSSKPTEDGGAPQPPQHVQKQGSSDELAARRAALGLEDDHAMEASKEEDSVAESIEEFREVPELAHLLSSGHKYQQLGRVMDFDNCNERRPQLQYHSRAWLLDTHNAEKVFVGLRGNARKLSSYTMELQHALWSPASSGVEDPELERDLTAFTGKHCCHVLYLDQELMITSTDRQAQLVPAHTSILVKRRPKDQQQ